MKKKNKGITLIALVVTIIILLILAGVSISLITGENGLIAKTRLTVFITEMQGIKESVKLKQVKNLSDSYTSGTKTDLFEKKFNSNEFDILDSLKKEILYGRAGLPEDGSPEDYDVEDFDSLLDADGNVEGIYIIDKATGNGREDTYVYDEVTDMVFKIPATSIAGKVYHSYETAVKGKGGESSEGETGGFIKEGSEANQVGNIYYYWPNLKGFNGKNAYVIYYSGDFKEKKEVTAEEYMAKGQQRQIEGEDGKTYTLHDYSSGSKVWANIKTVANNQEAWWVWIPRYAYKITGQTVDIEYIGIDDVPLNPEKDALDEGYVVHPSFNVGNKKLKGIWMSKYEPSFGDVSLIGTSSKVLKPDVEGFDKNKKNNGTANTYVVYYSDDLKETKEVPLEEYESKGQQRQIQDGEKTYTFYDYQKKIWANIKTVANNQEAWWVWIPRYAYNALESTKAQTFGVIFVNTDDKPLDKIYGTELLEGVYKVHSAFNTKDGKKLTGIWMSKYEPSFGDISLVGTSNKILEPNIDGFDETNKSDGTANTYVVYYSKDLKNTKEIPLADYISNGKQRQIQDGEETYTFYDYPNKIWANIKTVANGQEAWWVWIPRYAYNTLESSRSQTFGVIFVDINDNLLDEKYSTVDGIQLQEGIYKVHPAFNEKDGKKLTGIWMSKYEPSEYKE